MCVFRQGEGALTYAGRMRTPTVYGPHHTGKESLDINLLKVERHSAAPLACDDDAAPACKILLNNQSNFEYLKCSPIRSLNWTNLTSPIESRS